MTRRVRAGVLGLVLSLTTLAGCTGSTVDSPSHEATTSNAATGRASSSPFVVAAAAVGTRSRDQVVALHAMGLSTTTKTGVPHAELPAQGKAITTALRAQVTEATRLPPPAGSPAARLVGALRGYASLADRLAAWDPTGSRLPTPWFDSLASTDRTWTSAMRELSTVSGKDLLADLPALTVPSS